MSGPVSRRRSLLSVGFAAFLEFTSANLEFRNQELFEATASIAAVVFVTWMIFWMRRAARGIAGDLRTKMQSAIEIGPIAVVVTAFLAVAREGLETALFFFATVQSNEADYAVVSRPRWHRHGGRAWHRALLQRGAHQPHPLLHLDRCAARARGRRNPQVRGARSAGGRCRCPAWNTPLSRRPPSIRPPGGQSCYAACSTSPPTRAFSRAWPGLLYALPVLLLFLWPQNRSSHA